MAEERAKLQELLKVWDGRVCVFPPLMVYPPGEPTTT